MAKRKINLTQEQQYILLKNPNVENVTDCSIKYTDQFKQVALELNSQGVTAKQIFKDAGIDLKIIGKDAPNNSLGNWKQKAKSNVKKSTKYLATQSKKNAALKAVLDENKYLRAENEFLKKLQALEEILG